uniref:Mitochondrial import inner membrane translocase subunit n=1 Tax=Tetraselmis sp. GSL018 TaxID=582737 RepID=A0A061S2G3_9CHLO|mmetsp:Transcript_29869/g.71198  ORF Transcript_29869/g.71198 Transcript_29869/m.71198 type:complete len:86 (+) Transcript_29869:138-395(+)|eukprot:CAMPEP_0177608566 /NCGR_PEP_ID=MMETSP0419_2-20121207/18543_1 /TAXON_ID=582737 /ORGANISM="Tetraselmis sp., Strain GSL018" /LENGTH=85 /DNA_ID=CAMNT_0019103271 /DNA_START=99 /DNA_END=356 /DNA_ORIENTATION=-
MSEGSSQVSPEVQKFLQIEQEKAKLQEMVSKLANVAFDKCIGYPGRSMSNSEQNCVANTVARFFDSSEFVLQYFQSKARSSDGGY